MFSYKVNSQNVCASLIIHMLWFSSFYKFCLKRSNACMITIITDSVYYFLKSIHSMTICRQQRELLFTQFLLTVVPFFCILIVQEKRRSTKTSQGVCGNYGRTLSSYLVLKLEKLVWLSCYWILFLFWFFPSANVEREKNHPRHLCGRLFCTSFKDNVRKVLFFSPVSDKMVANCQMEPCNILTQKGSYI